MTIVEIDVLETIRKLKSSEVRVEDLPEATVERLNLECAELMMSKKPGDADRSAEIFSLLIPEKSKQILRGGNPHFGNGPLPDADW